MSPVSPSEVRAVDDQVAILEKIRFESVTSLALVRAVQMIWNILKREHGWR